MVSLPARHHSARPGYLLLELILGIALFGIFLVATSVVMLQGQTGTIAAGDRIRAVFAADRALEVAQGMGQAGEFSSLSAGSYGVSLGVAGVWGLSAQPTSESGGMSTLLTLTASGADWRTLDAQTTWHPGGAGTGTLHLYSDVIDWRAAHPEGDWEVPMLDGRYVAPDAPKFTAVAIAGNTAFVAAASTPGLFLLNLTDTTEPMRIASSFTLGAGARAVAVRGKYLVVLTDDPSSELRVYDISSPASLSADNLVKSVDVAGNALANVLALDGDTLYVGMRASESRNRVYAYALSATGGIMQLSAAQGDGDVNGIALSGTAAVLATSDLAEELGIVNVADPMHIKSEAGYNVTGGLTGLSIAATGTGVILGQEEGVSNVSLRTFQSGEMHSSLYHQGSGSIVGMDVDAGGCYVFLAAASGHKALQIMRIKNPSLPEVGSYEAEEPVAATGVSYDPVRDRVYLLTDTSFIILRPGAPNGSCQ